jgi:hypothetical protein
MPAHQVVRPDLGRRALEVVPQVPPDSPEISGENIRLGNGSVAVSADATGDTYTTTVGPDVALRELLVGHTVPADKEVASVTLDRARCRLQSPQHQPRQRGSGQSRP